MTPVLRTASGEEIALDPVTIASNASTSVRVNEALLKHSPGLLSQPGAYGSVVFRFASFHATNVYATTVVSMQAQPIAFPVARPVALLGAGSRGSLEGIWWQPRSGLTDVLIISNSSEKRISGNLSLFDASGRRWRGALALAPHQTRRMATSELLHKAGFSGSYGGISFEVAGFASALDGVHFMYDEASKSSFSLDMSRRNPQQAEAQQRLGSQPNQWASYSPMLALRTPDPAAGLPASTELQPTILVHNTTSGNVSASLTLDWRGESGRGESKLPNLELAPFATQQFEIAPMQKQLGIPPDAHWAQVTLSGMTSRNELIAVASSSDLRGRYNLATPFSDNVGGSFSAGEWRVDTTHNHIIAVTNCGQKPAEILLTLHYDNGGRSYQMQQTIQPGDQMWANLADLARLRIPDRDGSVLPATAAAGTYEIQDISDANGELVPGALALDTTFGFHTRPATQKCCGDTGVVWSPDVFDFSGLGETDPATIIATDSCSGAILDISDGFGDWWSSNTGVAIVTTRTVQSVAPGTTTATTSGEVYADIDGNCSFVPWQTTAPVTVKPQITSIAPNNGQVAGVSQVTISGSGFGASPTVNVSPIGVAVSGTKVDPTGTSISVMFTIPSTTTAGPYSVTVSVPSSDGGASQTSNSVTFNVTACASITNFQRKSWRAITSTGELDITYLWNSSTGNLSDLAACQQSEYVTYPGTSAPIPGRDHRLARHQLTRQPWE